MSKIKEKVASVILTKHEVIDSTPPMGGFGPKFANFIVVEEDRKEPHYIGNVTPESYGCGHMSTHKLIKYYERTLQFVLGWLSGDKAGIFKVKVMVRGPDGNYS